MNRIMTAVAAVFVIPCAALLGQSRPRPDAAGSSMSQREIETLVKSAHSVAEYKYLADYFHQREADYRVKAAVEKAELDRRVQINAALYQKYPRPADSAQSIYDSYLAGATQAALQAERFDALAAGQEQRKE